MRSKTSMLLALLVSLTGAAPRGEPLTGIFALQGGSAKTQGYLLAEQIGSNPLDRRIDMWLTPLDSNAAISAYSIDMTKLLHLIVVSDDFRTFLHLHPILDHDGHFLIDQQLPRGTVYHLYADAEPEDIGQQVFRFDLAPTGVAAAAPRDLSERSTHATAGPYVVNISTNELSSQGESRLVVHIRKNGKPAGDLHPYLGALAHAVFLNARDLSYVHVHPMPLASSKGEEMQSMSDSTEMQSAEMKPLADSAISSPDMQLHVELREPGTYKLWLQFHGGNHLYVAPFVVTAR